MVYIKKETGRGFPFPMGATLHKTGTNFTLFSRNASRVWLCLFAKESSEPSLTIELDSVKNKTGDIWHIWVNGIGEGTIYGFRIDGPYQPEAGYRFNKHRLILDPYAKSITPHPEFDARAALAYDPVRGKTEPSFSGKDNFQSVPKCVVLATDFDWEDDEFPAHLWSGTVIYETHVRGLTIHPSSGCFAPGTYAGVMEKIPYFRELGITALEFMPVQQFVENENDLKNPVTGKKFVNYWGYNPILYFAPHQNYAGSGNDGKTVDEFKRMVKALHKAGIEVILDIVLNHTAEGNELGPTWCYKGIDNSIFYLLEVDKRYYKNFSGCGNSLNCNHPVVRDFILNCLRYWVTENHVDGFRFDLASVMGRDEQGNISPNPPLLERIAEDPILRNSKLIAEAWDAAGAYQVGSFSGIRWAEWNACFRDDVRKFWRGDPGIRGAFASRICGSADIYQKTGKEPLNSINLITCHDGMTLNDLVSYSHKHNEANGENNRDGAPDDFSFNFGVEGETDNQQIGQIRNRQIKNLIATLLLSRGIPMLLGGDEFRRTQKGNNNAYCQDNEISWYNWEFLKKNREIFRFTKEMIAFRKMHPVLTTEAFYRPEDIVWFDIDGLQPDWESLGRTLGCIIISPQLKDDSLCLLFNADFMVKRFNIPEVNGLTNWMVVVDTSREPPYDIALHRRNNLIVSGQYILPERSLAVLVGR